MESRVVDLEVLVVSLVVDELLKAVSPEDLLREVGCTRLRRHPRALDHALEDDDQLELFLAELLRRHVPERTRLVDLVLDDDRPHEEDATVELDVAAAVGDLQRLLTQRHHLALLRRAHLHEHRVHVRLDDMRLAHVADAKQQTHAAVAPAHHRVLAEHQRLGALLRAREFREHESRHERLDDDAEARLQHHGEYRLRAVAGRVPTAVPDRVLRLNGEQQRRREVVHFLDAWLPVGHAVVLKVAVHIAYKPPDERKHVPAEHERQDEHKKVPAPFYIDQRREDVREIALVPLADVLVRDVVVAVLVHDAMAGAA